MSDSKPVFQAPRTIPEIQQEYQSTCLRAGDLQYRIETNKKDLSLLNERLRDLNFEAIAAKKAADDAAKAAAAETAKKAADETTTASPEVAKNA